MGMARQTTALVSEQVQMDHDHFIYTEENLNIEFSEHLVGTVVVHQPGAVRTDCIDVLKKDSTVLRCKYKN